MSQKQKWTGAKPEIFSYELSLGICRQMLQFYREYNRHWYKARKGKGKESRQDRPINNDFNEHNMRIWLTQTKVLKNSYTRKFCNHSMFNGAQVNTKYSYFVFTCTPLNVERLQHFLVLLFLTRLPSLFSQTLPFVLKV